MAGNSSLCVVCFEFSENGVDAVLISSGFADPDKRPEFDADPMNAVAPFPNQQLQQMRLLRGIRRREVRLPGTIRNAPWLRSDVINVGLIRSGKGHTMQVSISIAEIRKM